MVRLVLWDIDGTLIQSGGAGERAFARVFRTEFGVADGTDGLQFAGRTDPSIVREFFQRNGIDPSPANFQRFFDAYVFWLDHLLQQLEGRVLPDVRVNLAALRAQPDPPLCGLLTGNIRLGAEIKLTHFGLWEEFTVGGFGDDHEDRNQIAAIAHQRGNALAGRKLAGDEVLVIGDTPKDIECARAIGAQVLAVASGKFSLDELQAHNPTWAVESLAGIRIPLLCDQAANGSQFSDSLQRPL
jgi:phosphoglycolate phosphatase-like HAD superfamily hydrolase